MPRLSNNRSLDELLDAVLDNDWQISWGELNIDPDHICIYTDTDRPIIATIEGKNRAARAAAELIVASVNAMKSGARALGLYDAGDLARRLAGPGLKKLAIALNLVRRWYEQAPIQEIAAIEAALEWNFPYREVIAALAILGQAPERESILMPDVATHQPRLVAQDYKALTEIVNTAQEGRLSGFRSGNRRDGLREALDKLVHQFPKSDQP